VPNRKLGVEALGRAGRADEPLLRSRSERRESSEERSGCECCKKIGAPGDWGSSGGSKGRAAGVGLERDVSGSVTRVRLRRKGGEPDRGVDGGTALGGNWRVVAEGVGRGELRASSKFCKGVAERERGRDSGDCVAVSSLL
jgi:hypothetical protein